MEKVYTSRHTLVQHKLTKLRSTETNPKKVRELIREISALITYEATTDLLTEAIEISTPLEEMSGPSLAEKIGLVDQPGERKIHAVATPRLGGLAIIFGFGFPLLLFAANHRAADLVFKNLTYMFAVLASGALLVGQVTVSTVLLVTAFLFVRNLARSQSTNPGFEVQHALVAQLGLDEARAMDDHIALLERAVERVRALPGVESAAYSRVLPLSVQSGSSNGRFAQVDGEPAQHVEFALGQVGPGYFGTMGIRLLQGREFSSSDLARGPRVAIVNEQFARRYFRGGSLVGRRVRFTDDTTEIEIVGMVANSKYNSLGEEQRPAFYQPVRQYTSGLGVAFVIARVRTSPSAVVTATRRAIGELDRSVAVEVTPMRSALAFALLPSQVGAAILGTLGALGLVLAMFGLYAIVAYTVSRRVGEIAIRSALGATHRQVVGLVIRDSAVLVGIGLALGLGIAAFVTRPLATFLVTGLSATDPLSFAATAGAFALVSALASWIPATRATRVSPSLAMRLE